MAEANNNNNYSLDPKSIPWDVIRNSETIVIKFGTSLVKDNKDFDDDLLPNWEKISKS